MIILPAIDIQGGTCVRLFQGDFSTAQKVAEDPVDTAIQFRADGAAWIHMVDLDGAKHGSRENTETFLQVAARSGLQVELGGGIRDLETVSYYLERGISRVILGSAAVKNPALVQQAVQRYGSRIAVGIDAKNGIVATEGWLDRSGVSYLELAKQMEQIGVQYLIFTDISRDGTLSGLNLEQLDAINRAVSCRIIASGGVRSLADIEACQKLGLYGVICGKSLYQGTLKLKEAIRKAGEQTC
ncbi:MAG TPA: 1-(5-phosphoribosyl)-5-[(5-phosphoribosylamino)methylideneamino]imidazole-4-carboxamide isomerase [Candidatus Anaerotruncus excrementipullorum]|uniref:1-(5-phosphoribosyl)-5-[(5-phosphoribosylamino)methylideneamino] imidazole-4-carboxamide isomerase n=1 Tax=Candidatus Anaerotruncus excrementipullorum TaxID=2838465 RepID=A0A9D1WPI6_9FIRM|nr:1-(5-phosphoribosyl)-5-[(5-phosphoribosylamino)methylideneamino]imidazole-4-carboxamide isomerase [Candidatus Anaerotruncus excrementipullorum]